MAVVFLANAYQRVLSTWQKLDTILKASLEATQAILIDSIVC